MVPILFKMFNPLFPNIKNYPLVNEVIMIVALANKEYQDDYNNLSWYYLNPINLWNSPQSNPLPPPQYNTSPATQKKGYRQVEDSRIPQQTLSRY
jgi:hypothetical protein